MSILSFDKPQKIIPTEEHNERYSSDTNVAGTYVPNMSREDRLKWKAKQIGGDDTRVEIRKTIGSTQMLIIVRPDAIKLTANGKMVFTTQEWYDLYTAVKEATELL